MRFLPLVALATFSLLALKLAGLMLDGRYTLTGTQVTKAQDAAPQNKEAKANGDGETTDEATKGNDADKPQAAAKDQPAAGSDKAEKGKAADEPPTDQASLNQKEFRSQGEIALLSSLAKRREQIEKREKEFEMRMTLLKAAEKRIEARIAVLKELEGKIQQYAKQREDEQTSQYKRLVKMYSGMKPKDAARIFNDLDGSVTLELMKQMKPQAMSAILAQMEAGRARDLTIAMAGATKEKLTEQSLQDLPKIVGQ